MFIFQTAPDEDPRRHRLADGELSSLCRPSPSFSSFGAASDGVMFRSSCLFEQTLTAVWALPEYQNCCKYNAYSNNL